MADGEGEPALLWGMTRKTLVIALAALILVASLGGLATGEAILLVSARQHDISSALSQPSPTGTITATQVPTSSPGGSGPSTASTPIPTFPPATPQPPLYSVSLVSKVFGTNKPDVGMNIQVWPPDRNVSLRVTYSVCPAQVAQTSALVPPWSDLGVGEVVLDVGSCWQQGNTIQLDITAYWANGQTGRLQTTATVNW